MYEVQRGLGTRKYLERCFISEVFVWSRIEEPFDFFKFNIGYDWKRAGFRDVLATEPVQVFIRSPLSAWV